MKKSFNSLADRKFGIELEISRRLTRNNNADKSHSPNWKLLRSNIEELAITGKSFGWRLKTDTSCGGEIVSAPMIGNSGLKQMIYMCEMAKNFSKKTGVQLVDGECGLHFHFDVGDFTAKSFGNLFVLTQLAEPIFYNMFPNRRMDYCGPISINVPQMSRARDMVDVRDVWYRPENNVKNNEANYSPHFINNSAGRFERYDGTRYHGLNIHCYWDIGTVEFRYCEGTFNPSEILAWYDICLAIVNASAQNIRFKPDNFLSSKTYSTFNAHFSSPRRFRQLMMTLSKSCGLSRRAIKYMLDKIRKNNPSLLRKTPFRKMEIHRNNAASFNFYNPSVGVFNNSGVILYKNPTVRQVNNSITVGLIRKANSTYRMISKNKAYSVILSVKLPAEYDAVAL